jgi:lipoyl-dependent peroxiredoxin
MGGDGVSDYGRTPACFATSAAALIAISTAAGARTRDCSGTGKRESSDEIELAKELIMTKPEKVLFTARVHTTGGREGASRSSDGRLDIKLSSPGSAGGGTNPEQLFATGWSACFEGAMGVVARKMKVALPADTAIDAEVDLCLTDGAYFLQARLNVSLPGIERGVAQALVNAAHLTCPYSKATRGNVDVVITFV